MDSDLVARVLAAHGYETLGTLGKGGYAIIFKVLSKKYANKVFVAKAMYINGEHRQSRIAAFSAENDALCHLTHPNVINMYDNFFEENYFFQILDFCEQGSLYDLSILTGQMKPSDLIFYFKPIIEALSYCHKNNISHCDIKPSNILLDGYGRPIVADFGLCQNLTLQDNQHFKGSRPYMAPELFERSKYDPFKADVWALGVSLFQMAAGELPWDASRPDLMQKLIRSGIIQFPMNFGLNLRITIKKMLNVNPAGRPTMEECLNLPLFVQDDNGCEIVQPFPKLGIHKKNSMSLMKLNTGVCMSGMISNSTSIPSTSSHTERIFNIGGFRIKPNFLLLNLERRQTFDENMHNLA